MNLRVSSILLLFFAASPANIFADLITYIPGAASHRADGPYTIGNLFTVGDDDLLLTHLGAQDNSANGPTNDGFFSPPISVGLWNATGTSLLASASVQSAEALVDTYRYAPINGGGAITLTAGNQYLIGAAVGGGREWFEDGGSTPLFTGNGITLNESRFISGGTLSAPTSQGTLAAGRWAPANAITSVIPEPGTLSLFVLGLGCLTGLRRFTS